MLRVSFLSVCQSHVHLRFLIWSADGKLSVLCHMSSLLHLFGHHIFNIPLRYLLIKDRIFLSSCCPPRLWTIKKHWIYVGIKYSYFCPYWYFFWHPQFSEHDESCPGLSNSYFDVLISTTSCIHCTSKICKCYHFFYFTNAEFNVTLIKILLSSLSWPLLCSYWFEDLLVYYLAFGHSCEKVGLDRPQNQYLLIAPWASIGYHISFHELHVPPS